jgi:inorganic phosphate transporter, PiT family
MTVLLVVIIVLALGFDYINGFHDAANSVATIVSTRVLTPRQAVLWAATFNFAAFFIFTEHGVAKTISKTVLEPYITLPLVVSGLIAAIIWNLLTWWKGIPSSSSHTLLGGLMGAAIAHAGFQSLNATPIIKAASFIFLAPMLGMLVAILIALWFLHSFRKALYPKLISLGVIAGMVWLAYSQMTLDPQALLEAYNSHSKDLTGLKLPHDTYFANVVLQSKNFKWILLVGIVSTVSIFTMFLGGMAVAKAERWFRRMQLVSSAAFCIGHGGNDAQKVMGIIAVALVAEGLIPDASEIPNWVALACYAAIALGTMSGGWKIIKTMGSKITKVTPFEGVVADTAGASILFFTENLSIPVSTTHTVAGAIIGAGSMRRLSAVRWGVTRRLLIAWIITIPVSALMGAAIFGLYALGELIAG